MLRPTACKILILGLLLPSAALALGLGDIHVESALHQPLAVRIEIVGASPDTSAGLSATIPDSETFQRYGLERPASLASTGLTVRQDAQGRTVLVLRSTDAFTEPMVTFLVDLHSSSGELIREYSTSYLVEEIKHDAEHSSLVAAPIASDVSEAPLNRAAPIREPTVKLPMPHPNNVDTTAVLALHADLTNDDTAAREFAFFNPESTLNATHVMIANGAQEAQPFVERRKNPADVLRQAIGCEPDRSDLRLKLLELYYTAAAQNRRAFVEVVHQLEKNEKLASPHDWSQIADMGKAIAPDNELFANGVDQKAVA